MSTTKILKRKRNSNDAGDQSAATRKVKTSRTRNINSTKKNKKVIPKRQTGTTQEKVQRNADGRIPLSSVVGEEETTRTPVKEDSRRKKENNSNLSLIDKFISDKRQNSRFVKAEEFKGRGKLLKIQKLDQSTLTIDGQTKAVLEVQILDWHTKKERIWSISGTRAARAIQPYTGNLEQKPSKMLHVWSTGTQKDTEYYARKVEENVTEEELNKHIQETMKPEDKSYLETFAEEDDEDPQRRQQNKRRKKKSKQQQQQQQKPSKKKFKVKKKKKQVAVAATATTH